MGGTDLYRHANPGYCVRKCLVEAPVEGDLVEFGRQSRALEFLGRVSQVLLAYVDESYNRDFYYMVALLCPDHVLQELAAEMDAVAVKAAIAYDGIALDTELHSADSPCTSSCEVYTASVSWNAIAIVPTIHIP